MTVEPEPRPAPRPSRLLIGLSALVIGGCLVVSGFLSAALFNPWDLCALAAAVFHGPLPVTLLTAQYAGVFRRKIVAAQLAAVALAMLGFVSLLGVASFAIGVANDYRQGTATDAELWSAAKFGATVLVFPCVICLAAAWQDWRWARVLFARSEPEVAETPATSGWWLPALAVVAVLGMGWTISLAAPPFAENVGPENAPRPLPAGASDVSYCTTSRGSERIEFTIDEADFRQWVDDVVVHIRSTAKGDVSPLAEIKDHVVMTRYNGVLGRSPEPDPPTFVDVREGLVYRWTYTDHNVVAVYDRSTRRAYLSVDWY